MTIIGSVSWQWITTIDNEWQRMVQRMTTSGTTSGNKWQQMIMSDSEWQKNENGTLHIKEWMFAILSITKTDTLLQGILWLVLEWLNK